MHALRDTCGSDPEEPRDNLELLIIFAPAIQEMLAQPTVTEEAGAPGHLHQQLAEAPRHAFSTTRDCSDTAEPRKGSRPGNGVADYGFNVAFSRVTKGIAEDLDRTGLRPALPRPGEQAIFMESGNDDMTHDE